VLKPSASVVPVRSHDFRLLVIQKLTLLETMMADLVGNGRPGRIQQLEDKVRSHDRLFWVLTGAGAVVGWLLQRFIG
jgi:hypothetical protein